VDGRAKEFWGGLLQSLAISFPIAFAFLAFGPTVMGPKDIRFTLISGVAFGVGFFGAGMVMERVHFRSFALTVLVRSVMMWLTFYVCITVVIWAAVTMDVRTAQAVPPITSPFDARVFSILAGILFSHTMLVFGIVGYFIAAGINGFLQMNRKLGPGILRNWMLGKYHEPKEEERIFMFLDLKNSTPLAEKLGNIRFSRLVRDFFHDLTYPVLQTGGEVSHYIGDEAVLSWRPSKGIEKANCVQCFTLMSEAIRARSTYYMREYGIVPEFKAGIHIGQVVATEVGDIKSEVVFHGDVLNTTARITGLCASIGSDLLVSGDLMRRLVLPDGIEMHSIGPQLLKGKEHEVEVFALGAPIPESTIAERALSPSRR
jgi:adenylate cyclase